MTVEQLIQILEGIENKKAEIACSDGTYGWSAETVTVKEIGEGVVEIS